MCVGSKKTPLSITSRFLFAHHQMHIYIIELGRPWRKAITRTIADIVSITYVKENTS